MGFLAFFMAKDTRDCGSYKNDSETNARIEQYFAKQSFRQAKAKLENRLEKRDQKFLKQAPLCQSVAEKAELLLNLKYVTNPDFPKQGEDVISSAFEAQLASVKMRFSAEEKANF